MRIVVLLLLVSAAALGSQSKNLIVNGGMNVAQRGTSFAAAASGSHSLDFWKLLKVGGAAFTMSQDTSSLPNALSQYALKALTTTASAAPSSGDYVLIQQTIEGSDLAAIKGRVFTLSFWVRGAKTGAHCVSFTSVAGDANYASEYTISAANTWEKKSITLTHSPSTGTWAYTAAGGMQVNFWLMSKGTKAALTNNTWTATAAGNFATTGCDTTNEADTLNNVFEVAQVMLNEGAVAAPFQMAGGNWGQELSLAQRRYRKSYAYATAPATTTVVGSALHETAGGVSWFTFSLSPPMRVTPTGTVYSTVTGATSNCYDRTAAGDTAAQFGGGSIDSDNQASINLSATTISHRVECQYALTADY